MGIKEWFGSVSNKDFADATGKNYSNTAKSMATMRDRIEELETMAAITGYKIKVMKKEQIKTYTFDNEDDAEYYLRMSADLAANKGRADYATTNSILIEISHLFKGKDDCSVRLDGLILTVEAV